MKAERPTWEFYDILVNIFSTALEKCPRKSTFETKKKKRKKKKYRRKCIRVQISWVFGTKTKTMFSENNPHSQQISYLLDTNPKCRPTSTFASSLLLERKLLPASLRIFPPCNFFSWVKKLPFWVQKGNKERMLYPRFQVACQHSKLFQN